MELCVWTCRYIRFFEAVSVTGVPCQQVVLARRMLLDLVWQQVRRRQVAALEFGWCFAV